MIEVATGTISKDEKPAAPAVFLGSLDLGETATWRFIPRERAELPTDFSGIRNGHANRAGSTCHGRSRLSGMTQTV
jgi:hypothetical protein